MNTDTTTLQDIPNYQDELVLMELNVHLVPNKDWAKRMTAGQPPAMFYGIKGVALIKGTLVSCEWTVPACGSNGEPIALGVELNDEKHLCVPEKNDHSIPIETVQDAFRDTRAKIGEDGMPAAKVPVAWAPGWDIRHACKWYIPSDPAKGFKVKNVSIGVKPGVFTSAKNGNMPCAMIKFREEPEVVAVVVATAAPKPAGSWGRLAAARQRSDAKRV